MTADGFYTVSDIAKLFNCSRNKSYEIIHTEGVPKIKIGKNYYLPKQQFHEWVESKLESNAVK